MNYNTMNVVYRSNNISIPYHINSGQALFAVQQPSSSNVREQRNAPKKVGENAYKVIAWCGINVYSKW